MAGPADPGGETRGYQLAVIEGDGIGPEIVDAALEVLRAAGRRFGFHLDLRPVPAGAAEYRRHGAAISAAGLAAVRAADATLKGPVGLPEVRLPDGTEAGVLGGILRNGLDLYANVRPIQLLPGAPTRLDARPGEIDYVIVRENTEGLYAARGRGVGNRWAVADTMIITRPGTERIARFAFELALRRAPGARPGPPLVTCVDKANVLRGMYLFREVFLEVAAGFPAVRAECLYADAAAQALVVEPERFDVLVTENMFGDILSDLGGGTVGGIALCPGANIGDECAYFEPIHGSAPALASTGTANPVGQILAGAMLLDHLGEHSAGDAIRAAVRDTLASGTLSLARNGAIGRGTAGARDAIVNQLEKGAW